MDTLFADASSVWLQGQQSDDEDLGLEANDSRHVERGGDADEGGEGEGTEEELPVGAIDAYWLQRECSRYFNDPLLAQKVAEVRLEGRDRGESGGGSMHRMVSRPYRIPSIL